MPVDFTGLLLAVAIWIGGTIFTYRRLITHNKNRQVDNPLLPTLAWTLLVSAGLIALGVFIVWLYDFVTVG